MTRKPVVGHVVHYTLTHEDAEAINAHRITHTHAVGNHAYAGQVHAATVVALFNPHEPKANLQVHLDGNDTHWATSRRHDADPDEHGTWRHLPIDDED